MSKEAMKLRTAAEKVVEICSERPLSLGKWFIDMSEACESLREALAEQPAQQEPVAKPYAYEYGRDNGDGTYSVVIEKGDLVQTAPAVYNYVHPRNAHKDWPIKELFDRPPAQRKPPYGWVRMNPGFNSGVFHLGTECPPGWVGGAIAVQRIKENT